MFRFTTSRILKIARLTGILLLIFCRLFSTARAEESLFDLSLEELLQFEIVTVSKRTESLNDAPGVVTVFSEDDIRKFGARNLKDVLQRIPNYYSFNSYAFTGTGQTLRAGATQHINNHVLYLVNGRPLRESQNGGRQTDINLMFPLVAIDRVEVIRGPGSALYGSNAFNGTINIITKESKRGIGGEVVESVGQNGYHSIQAQGYVHSNSGAHIGLQMNFLTDDGSEISAYDDRKVKGSSRLERDGYFLRLDGGFMGFSIEAMASEIELPNIGGPFQWTGLGDWTHRRRYVNLGYEHEFAENWHSSVDYTFNNAEIDVLKPAPIGFVSDGYLLEWTLNGEIGEKADLLFGMVHDKIKGDLNSRGGRYENGRNSLYGQLDYRFTSHTQVTVGGQWNKPEGQALDFSPRLALVHKMSDHWSSKVLFAEAYRSPFGTENYFDSTFLLGDTNLRPETIQTSELQVIYSNHHGMIASTLYTSKSDDLIGRRRTGDTTYYVNIDQEIDYRGVELEGRWYLTPKLQFQGNASYQENQDDEGHENIMVASNYMAKMGLSYTANNGVTMSVWNNYFGDVSKLEDMPYGSSIVVENPSADSVNLFSLNIVANLGELFKSRNWDVAEVSLFVDNLFDEDVWFPEMGQKSVNTYPQGGGRSAYFSVSVEY